MPFHNNLIVERFSFIHQVRILFVESLVVTLTINGYR